jgi:hypothetical protein
MALGMKIRELHCPEKGTNQNNKQKNIMEAFIAS